MPQELYKNAWPLFLEVWTFLKCIICECVNFDTLNEATWLLCPHLEDLLSISIKHEELMIVWLLWKDLTFRNFLNHFCPNFSSFSYLTFVIWLRFRYSILNDIFLFIFCIMYFSFAWSRSYLHYSDRHLLYITYIYLFLIKLRNIFHN